MALIANARMIAPSIPKGSSSEGGIVSEIQTLKLAIDALGQTISLWNRLMIWSFSLAALFTICGIAATKIVVWKTEEQSTKQGLLNIAEDRQLQADLKTKDFDIGNLKLRAAGLELEAERLRTQLSLQQRRADILMDPHTRAVFGNPLKRFRGQKFDVMSCGIKESEITYFSMAVWSTLAGDHAGWAVGKIENDSP